MTNGPTSYLSDLLQKTGLFSESQVADLVNAVRMEEKVEAVEEQLRGGAQEPSAP